MHFELACLKEKKKKKKDKHGDFSGLVLLQCFFCTIRHVVGHEALENEWYIVIKAY